MLGRRQRSHSWHGCIGPTVIATVTAVASLPVRADDVAEIHQMLDSVEQAWAQHDIDRLGAQYADDLLLIVSRDDHPDGALVADRTEALAGVQKFWQTTGIRSHRFIDRDITVNGDFAEIRLTAADRFPDHRQSTSHVFAYALERDRTWQMCFGMPGIAREVVFVTGVSGNASTPMALAIHVQT